MLSKAHENDCNVEPGIRISVEFMGGLDALFDNVRHLDLCLPATDQAGNAVTAGWLVNHLGDKALNASNRKMFVLDGHIRPGIMVIINDADWELFGSETYQLQQSDLVLFVSTLHGG